VLIFRNDESPQNEADCALNALGLSSPSRDIG
jgi:hypothetical protein